MVMQKNKNYIMNREELKNVILGAKSYIADFCREMIAQGKDPTKLTYRQTDQVIEDYIDSLQEIKIDDILDNVDEVLLKTTGFCSREYKEKMEKANG